MTDKKYPQDVYDKRWRDKNKEHRRYLSYRGTSRTFIRNYAKYEDIEELRKLLNERENKIKK